MKQLAIFIIAFLICHDGLFSQGRPELFPEDLDENSLAIKCYCKPGVRNKSRPKGIEISYQFLGNGEITAPNGEFGAPYPEYSKFRNFKAKLAFPIIRKEQFTTIIGASYSAEQFELSSMANDFQSLIGGTNNVNFKSTAIELGGYYSINEKNYIGGKFISSFNGSYDGIVKFDNRYAVYTGALLYGIKKDDDNEWGFGLAGSKNFRSQGFTILPYLFWNKTFDESWGMQITFPTSYKLRYNLDNKTNIWATANYNGESYSYDQAMGNSRSIAFNHAEILTRLKVEREIVPWLWMEFNIGYHFNFNSNFELQSTNESLLDVDPGNSHFIKIGVFISPPDTFLNKH